MSVERAEPKYVCCALIVHCSRRVTVLVTAASSPWLWGGLVWCGVGICLIQLPWSASDDANLASCCKFVVSIYAAHAQRLAAPCHWFAGCMRRPCARICSDSQVSQSVMHTSCLQQAPAKTTICRSAARRIGALAGFMISHCSCSTSAGCCKCQCWPIRWLIGDAWQESGLSP
jgi:hypothetical protein